MSTLGVLMYRFTIGYLNSWESKANRKPLIILVNSGAVQSEPLKFQPSQRPRYENW